MLHLERRRWHLIILTSMLRCREKREENQPQRKHKKAMKMAPGEWEGIKQTLKEKKNEGTGKFLQRCTMSHSHIRGADPLSWPLPAPDMVPLHT